MNQKVWDRDEVRKSLCRVEIDPVGHGKEFDFILKREVI